MENVIQTAPQAVIPTLYKAAAVSVIALSLAGIGAITGVLPVKRADAPQSVVGALQPALVAPAAMVPALPAPAAPAVAQTPAVERTVDRTADRAAERAPKPRVVRTASRRINEPSASASPVSNHPVAVSASGSDAGAYGQSPYGQQPYPQTAQNTPAKPGCHSCGTAGFGKVEALEGHHFGLGVRHIIHAVAPPEIRGGVGNDRHVLVGVPSGTEPERRREPVGTIPDAVGKVGRQHLAEEILSPLNHSEVAGGKLHLGVEVRCRRGVVVQNETGRVGRKHFRGEGALHDRAQDAGARA